MVIYRCRVNGGTVLNALRILSLSSIFHYPIEAVKKMLISTMGEVIRNLTIEFDEPEMIVTAAEITIDEIAKPDSGTRKWLVKTSKEITNEKSCIKNRYHSGRQFITKYPTLIAARRWNSWTPARPAGVSLEHNSDILRHKTGGGYFLSDGKVNLALDPGYGYLDMLYDYHGISVMDIDGILITHDHPDHSFELFNILSLRFVYKEACNPLKVFLNPSTFFLYERMLGYYSELIADKQPVKLSPGKIEFFKDLEIRNMGMEHEEIFHTLAEDLREKVKSQVGQSESLGLTIIGRSPDGTDFKFAIPGDTSFPMEKEILKKMVDAFNGVDIAAIHLGSLESDWEINESCNASEITYGKGKHLGLNGAIKLISIIKPRLAVLTEFGEELDVKNYRLPILDIINRAHQCNQTILLPSDIPLYIIKKQDNLYCKCSCKKFIPIEKAKPFIAEGDININYIFAEGCESGLDHFEF